MRRILTVALPLLLLLFFTRSSAFAAVRSFSLGSSGNNVKIIQSELIAKGYLAAGNATGYFGSLTLAAIEKFQCDHISVCSGASGYGIAGPQTQTALASPIQPGTIGPSLSGPATGAFETSGWVPYWSAVTSTSDVLPHLSQLTSVMPFGYTVTSDGALNDTAGLTQEPWTSFIAAAKAQHVRVVPTVMWGNGAAEQAILSNTTARIALENEIANTVRQNGFDGIDIDFEAKQAQTINYFSTFLKGLYQRMGNKWVYCTAEARMPLNDRYSPGATIPPDAADYANDYSAMNKYCDRVEIMAYDQGTIDIRLNAARSAPYAPIADPGWVEDLVSLAARSISKNKLIIGIPTYGYEYAVTPLPGSSYRYQVLWPFNPRYALDIAAKLGITPARTSAGELGFIYNPSELVAITSTSTAAAPTGSESTQTQQAVTTTTIAQNASSTGTGLVNTSQPFNYVTWSDAQAIKDKIALAHKLGVRGVALFSFGGEDQNMWNILNASGAGQASVFSGTATSAILSVPVPLSKIEASFGSTLASSTTPASFHFTRTLEYGSVGQDVRALQFLLNRDSDTEVAAFGYGSPGNETTYFGAATMRAVEKFQIKYGIASSGNPGFGTFGPKTRAKLEELLPAATTFTGTPATSTPY
ncbi:MAG: glycosyl hydrolase family 18 protein [Patescibacteria group bacterium]|nr:glycosyl hydrolase family 18 protein [Patescibacteria group bacterium]